ncbi:MAG TPA: hypothetical protein VFV05_22720, partial [Methylomirabilota bacterium]|nr:hypothetical protein [Methylomirabilota bacterium]
CRGLALELAPYAALSPARIVAELERLLGDEAPGPALAALARAGGVRLLAPGHRATRPMLAWLEGLPAALAWARDHAVAAPPIEVLATALAAGQVREVAGAVLRGLGLAGAPLDRVREALERAPALGDRLASARRPSEAGRAVRQSSPTALAWLRLAGDAATRARLERALEVERGARPALGGDDVLGLGVTRGPDVAAVLGALRDARADGEIRERQGEIDYVRTWVENRTGTEG